MEHDVLIYTLLYKQNQYQRDKNTQKIAVFSTQVFLPRIFNINTNRHINNKRIIMYTFFINNRDDVKTVRDDFKITRDHRRLLTVHQDKDYRIVFDKRVIMQEYSTRPYGF
jgi:hypothetical protein